MWSQCVCPRRMFALMDLSPRAINSAANRCAPVPQSKIRRSSLLVVNSTQEVLPPKWVVPGPGVAIDPRVPQKRTLMSAPPLHQRHDPDAATPNRRRQITGYPQSSERQIGERPRVGLGNSTTDLHKNIQ